METVFGSIATGPTRLGRCFYPRTFCMEVPRPGVSGVMVPCFQCVPMALGLRSYIPLHRPPFRTLTPLRTATGRRRKALWSYLMACCTGQRNMVGFGVEVQFSGLARMALVLQVCIVSPVFLAGLLIPILTEAHRQQGCS